MATKKREKKDVPKQNIRVIRGESEVSAMLAEEVERILAPDFIVGASDNGDHGRFQINDGPMPDLVIATDHELVDMDVADLARTLILDEKRPPRMMVVTRTTMQDRLAADEHMQSIRGPVSPKQLAAAIKKRLKEPADDLANENIECED